jgi:DNA repair protein RadC
MHKSFNANNLIFVTVEVEFQELRQFLPQRKAETLVAALSMSTMAEAEHALSARLDNPESIYRACSDMKLFTQEVLRAILLDTRYRTITTAEISKGTINESIAHPREIFRPAIVHSAYAFVLVHNHPSGAMSYPVLCRSEHGISSREALPDAA